MVSQVINRTVGKGGEELGRGMGREKEMVPHFLLDRRTPLCKSD